MTKQIRSENKPVPGLKKMVGGYRLAVSPDIGKNVPFNQALIKSASGDAELVVEEKWKNPETREVSATSLFLSNHDPTTLGLEDPAIRRRFRPIQGPDPIPEEKQVKGLARRFAGPTTSARRARQSLANLLRRHAMLYRDRPPSLTKDQAELVDSLLGKTISNVGIEIQRAIVRREGAFLSRKSLWKHMVKWAGVAPRIDGKTRQGVYDLAKNLISGLAAAEKRMRDPEDGNRVGLGYVGFALATEAEREEHDEKTTQGRLL